MIRPVELSPGKGSLQPPEDRFMPDVHPQRDLRLAAVSAEVSFADQQAGEEAEAEVVSLRWFSVIHVPAPEDRTAEGEGSPVRLRAARDIRHGHHLAEAHAVPGSLAFGPPPPPPSPSLAPSSLIARSCVARSSVQTAPRPPARSACFTVRFPVKRAT